MKKFISALLAFGMIFALTACGEGGSVQAGVPSESPVQSLEPAVENSEPVESETPAESETPVESESSGEKESGRYTLPSGMSVQFSNTVRNDVTGKWRISTTSDSIVPADCALEYYKEMFSSDDEIHAIWNATLGTTTRISVYGGLLFVDTLEYVDGEEHDANLLFSGELLDSKIIDIETGDFMEP